MQKTITIFGSATPKSGEEQYQFAYLLGKRLAETGFAICNGGYGGIMEAASKGAHDSGGFVYGVILENSTTDPNPFLTIEIRTSNLFERISKLIELGDAYIVLQGGTGTLLELAAVWELINKNLLKEKPVICHSIMWEQLINIVNNQLFSENKRTDIIEIAKSVDEIVEKLKLRLYSF